MNRKEQKNVEDHIASITVRDHTKACQVQLFSMVPPERHTPDDCWCHEKTQKTS